VYYVSLLLELITIPEVHAPTALVSSIVEQSHPHNMTSALQKSVILGHQYNQILEHPV